MTTEEVEKFEEVGVCWVCCKDPGLPTLHYFDGLCQSCFVYRAQARVGFQPEEE